MGTNYYLIKKVNIEEFNKYKDYMDFYDRYHEIQNGYIYRDVYYPTQEALEEALCVNLHIGKSSCGWHFLLCIYPELGINNLEDWKPLFNEHKIMSEDQEEIFVDEMLSKITDRAANGFDMFESVEAYEEHELSIINEFNRKYKLKTYSTYEQYLKANHASRGKNGLFRHDYWLARPTDGTYDLTANWDFS